MAIVNEALLDDQLGALEKERSWSPRVISKLENFVRSADDWALFRINPFVFAEERGIPEDEAVDLFLHASRIGLFRVNWSLVCPGCGAAVQSFSSLKNLSSTFRCFTCSMDIETRLDDFVHVGFTVSPKIREIPAHEPQALSIEDYFYRYAFTREARVEPGGPRFLEVLPGFVRTLRYVEPGATSLFEVDVTFGDLVVYDSVSSHVFLFLVQADGTELPSPLRLKLSDGRADLAPRIVTPGKLRIELENDGERRASLLVMGKPQEYLDEVGARAAAGMPNGMTFDRYLSGRRLLTSQTFRKIFGAETIRSSDGIGVRDVSILFTDLKGSTALYDRIGDLKAFALVNQHFERLGRAIARHRGAVVKTIGDAVMASFESPADAVHAAHDMLREIEAFNREVGEREIVLKVGVHRGASIAVTLNDRLDFFGQTVNIAARVQGLADADEIFITHEVYTAPGVKDVLGDLSVTPQQATLKGVQRAVSVYRLATAPAAS
jgi:class 3 adenylate cyclase